VSTKLTGILSAVPAPIAARFRTEAFVTRLARPLVNRVVPTGPVEVVVRSGPARGLTMRADLKSEKYFWTGTDELPVQKAIVERLSPGSRFWDIGAHVGFFTLLAARAVGAGGEVHAFEPIPQNRDQLIRAIDLNGFENVVVHPFAVSDRSGDVLLHSGGTSSTWSLRTAGSADAGVPAECRTLDELADALGPPDLIKVDVERAETDVLRGGSGLLSDARPAVIVEFSSDDLLREARALLPLYDFERIGPNHWVLT
jgi:FkbM family methyltransferase